MILSSERIQFIRTAIESSEVTHKSVQEDLIDHLCCAVEDKMQGGINFNNALQDAVKELAPRGFKEIEIESYYLLNSQIILMKKLKYGIALLGSMSFCFGIAAKTLQLSLSNDFLLFGLVCLTIGIPFLSFKQNMSALERVRVLTAFFSLFFITAGFTLKIMNSAGANLFVVIGSCLFATFFLPLYFLKLYRTSFVN